VDETATGSATSFGPKQACGETSPLSSRIAAMPHPPRPPSIDQGVVAFLWAAGLAVFVFFGLVAIGASGATSIVLALVAFAAIWILVRLRGEDVRPRR
jgi:hypothetical protein